ncbi:MAG: EAL domain-containing protein [Solirubrobacteraceae bacterium]
MSGSRWTTSGWGTPRSATSITSPLDIIKLDRRFISALQAGARAEAIVDAVVRIANALELQSVAEGIETSEQLEVVSRLGYTFVQGFHLMRPLDGDALGRVLRSASQGQDATAPGLEITIAQALLAGRGTDRSAEDAVVGRDSQTGDRWMNPLRFPDD